MKRLKSASHLQRFVSIHDPVASLFNIPSHDISSSHHRELREIAMEKIALDRIPSRRLNQDKIRILPSNFKLTVPSIEMSKTKLAGGRQ